MLQSPRRENGAEAAVPGDVSARNSENRSKAPTRTTLNDLFDTLKKLEEEETFISSRQEKKNSWRMSSLYTSLQFTLFGIC